ncbi:MULTISPECIES: hypothetical protein [Clostridium]|jgi:hypothetical protein|uniref:hypothetical protein n=1 Tax=Clostridium TaxID=1485 RepID=UPI00242C8FA5|nr:hypothetical protein [Clostridium tyrobutyricum]
MTKKENVYLKNIGNSEKKVAEITKNTLIIYQEYITLDDILKITEDIKTRHINVKNEQINVM